jgi:hypothetical protein
MNEQGSEQPSGQATRTVATIILIPTVPLLLLSVAALALFYSAPSRFGALLARLPGDELIRTVLIFAPATLFAVVVLAVLYALDQPAAEAAEPAPADLPIQEAARRSARASRIATWGLLAPGVPLLVLSVGLWLFSFIAPGRFAALLEPLPGDAYLRMALRAAPIALLAVVVPAALFLLLGGRQRGAVHDRVVDAARPIRWGVALTLLASMPLLLLSLSALAVFLFSPERFQSLLASLTQEAFLRIALVFTPAVLLSLVLLAVLFLFFSRPAQAEASDEPESSDHTRRQAVAVWVLTGGLAGSAVVALGLLGVALYLIVR